MIVTAALCWWDEPVHKLEMTVRSWANIADRVVALDGAYRRFPGASIRSDPAQAEAIRRTAEKAGLECLVLAPDRLWAGQLEKRTFLYQLAAIGSDWVLVVDADHHIHAEREAVRRELEIMPAEVGVIEAPMRVPLNHKRGVRASAPAEWHRINAGTVTRQRLLFRAYPGLRVEERHWRISAVVNGQRRWITHDDHQPTVPMASFLAPYEIEHRGLFHRDSRVAAQRAFYAERAAIVERTSQEDDLPGLPEHVESLPFVVSAALIWYDERPDDLEACVRGIATVADRLVAVDGAYQRYPNARVSSPSAQAQRIRKVAKEVGLQVEIHVPDRLWAGQVEKRSFAYAEAAKGSDWIAIFDSDWVASGDREAVRAELRAYPINVDVVTADLYTPAGQLSATNWHTREKETRHPTVHFLRALPDIKVETLHWWISANKAGQRVWLQFSQMPTPHPILTQHQLKARYEIEHRTLLRDEKHVLDSRAFCNDRVMVLEKTGQEDHVPGLPEPVWDYSTVPY
jgi:hypothetical protein